MAQGSSDETLSRLLPLALLLFALNSFRFMVDSAPGVTDIAHLRALALPFGQLIGWIAGATEPDLLPEPLRSAPLPLLIDWVLWRVAPIGLIGLRIIHLLLALGALGLLLQAIAWRMDARTAVVAGFVIALSPRLIEPVVNLGPDLFVLILFCLQLAILLSRGRIGGPAPLTAFAIAAATSGLCGITGMIASASLFAVLFLAAPDRAELVRRARMLLPVLVLWLFPLAVQVVAGSAGNPLAGFDLIRLGLKLFAHNADLLQLPGAVLLVGGTAALIGLGVYSYIARRRRNGRSERHHPFALLLTATIVGGALVLVTGPLLRLYVWIEPPAQSWLGLLIVLLASACFTPRLVASSSGLQRLRLIAAGAMIAGATVGTIGFQYRADWFAAGPEAGLERALQDVGRNRAIVYVSHDWERAYFPHDWATPNDKDQWLLSFDARSVRRVLPGGRFGPQQPLAKLDGYSALIIARIDRRGWRDLHGVTNMMVIGALPPAPLKGFSSHWHADPAQAAPGEYWLTTQLLRKPG